MQPDPTPPEPTALEPTAPEPTLGQRLRAATHALHRDVERAGVMRLLLQGELSLPGYCLLLRNLHAVYEVMERAWSAAAPSSGLQTLVPPVLWRAAALQQDLQQLHGSDWHSGLPVAPAARAYVQRLAVLQAEQPALLVAHAYVRYLGDLNGGQMLARLVAQLLGRSLVQSSAQRLLQSSAQASAPALPVQHGQGLAFYRFECATPVATLQTRFRLALDQQAHKPLQSQALVDEACGAFERHRDLFVELEGWLLQPAAPQAAAPASS